MSVEIDGIVAEAVSALGYFRQDASALLADRIARLWGNNAWALEKDGERINPIPGRPRYDVAAELWESLSAKGREDPAYACKATLLRVSFGVYRVRDEATESTRRALAAEARFAGITNYTCPVGRACQGKAIPLTRKVMGIIEKRVSPPPLPLEGCTADWCACRWDYIPRGR